MVEFACTEVVPRLARTTDEIGHILKALDGGYVPAGPSGSPTRGLVNVLPTGRNFYSVDPKAIPSRLSWEVGQSLADSLVQRYLQERGLLFTVDTLEFLQRGGRIGKAAAFAGTLLQVKPILSIHDGEVVPVKRVRGERKAFAELSAALETETQDEPAYRLAVAHAAAPERAADLEALVRERRPQAELELVVTLGAVIGAHAGPGTLALFWFRDGE